MTKIEYVSSPLMAEGLAVREAVLAAIAIHIPKVWIQSDSLGLVRALNSKQYPMELYRVLKDIELLSSTFSFFCFSHISRTCNSKADSVARNAQLLPSSTLY